MPAKKNRWLDSKHPIWIACRAEWERNERRARGGTAILQELRRFDWEAVGKGHYGLRQARATYVPLPSLFIETISGHIFRDAPQFDYGTMGKVERRKGQLAPSMAELIDFNIDGLGITGSQAAPFWQHSLDRAMATGHIWQMAEAPATPPKNQRDEIQGLHPYLVNFSTLQVTNWYEEEGVPQFYVVRLPYRRPARNLTQPDAELEGNAGDLGYYLLTRRGFDGFGPEYGAGGWWRFNPDGELMDRRGAPWKGTWDDAGTGGDIPLWPLFYRRDSGLVATPADEHLMAEREEALHAAGVEWNAGHPAMSRSAITELGAIAVSYMDVSSAADFDLWDMGQRLLFLMGVDPESHNIVTDMMADGNRVIPVQHAAGKDAPPTVGGLPADGGVADAFNAALDRKLKLAQNIAAMEASGAPDSSGASKEAGFTEKMVPRLSQTAGNLQSAMNTAIPALERRAAAGLAALIGGPIAATGTATVKRDFKIVDVEEAIRETFTLEKLTGYRSVTLGGQLMKENARRRGFLKSEDDAATIGGEYEDSAKQAAAAADQARRADASLGLPAA
jgi:hypothetical protein